MRIVNVIDKNSLYTVKIGGGMMLLLLLTSCLGGGGETDEVSVSTADPVETQIELKLLSSAQLFPGPEVVRITILAYTADTNIPSAYTLIDLNVEGHALIENRSGLATNGQGVINFELRALSEGNVTITAAVKSSEIAPSSQAGVGNSVLSPTYEELILYFGAKLTAISPSKRVAETAQLTVNLTDYLYQPISEHVLNLRLIGGQDEQLGTSSVVTDAVGMAQVTVTDPLKNGGRAILQVMAGQLMAETTVDFLANFDENQQLQVTVPHYLLTLQQPLTVTAQLTDEYGFPIQNQAVHFNLLTEEGQPSSAYYRPTQGLTDETGRVKLTVIANEPADLVLHVQAGTLSQTLPLYVVPQLAWLPYRSQGVMGENQILTASLTGTQGQGIAGIPLNFQIIAGQAHLTTQHGVTDETGQLSTEISSSEMGVVTIAVQTIPLDSVNADIAFQPATVELQVDIPQRFLALGETAEVTILVSDPDGNSLANFPIEVILSSSHGEELPMSTDDQGKAFFQITRDRAETVQVQVHSQEQTEEIKIYFGARLALLPVYSTSENKTARLTALLKDGQGLAIVGESVLFYLPNSNQQALSPGQSVTDKLGKSEVDVVDFSGLLESSVQVNVQVEGLSAQAWVSFVNTVEE